MIRQLLIFNSVLVIGAWLALPTASGAIAPVQAISQTTDMDIQMQLQQPAPASAFVLPWSLQISGVWPTSCLPKLTQINVEANDIRVEARSSKTLCSQQPTPFAFNVNPAAIMGQGLLAPGLYHVSFYTAMGAQAPLKLSGFKLIEAGYSDSASLEPESGFWWPKFDDISISNESGSGLSLERQGTTLIVSMMTYTDTGQPEWYFGSGSLAGNAAHIALLRMHGGAALFADTPPAFSQAETAMNLDLEFQSSAHAIAWLSRHNDQTQTLELRAMPLVRLPFSNEISGKAWQGEWALIPGNPEASIRRLRFNELDPDDQDRFRIRDGETGISLSCKVSHAGAMLPDSCTLYDATGIPQAQFHAVALTRLEGSDTSEQPVRLIRISH